MRARAIVASAVLAAAACGTLCGCGGGAAAVPVRHAAAAVVRPSGTPSSGPAVTSPPARLPGLGPRTLARVPADAGQAVVVTGAGHDSPDATVVLYQRTPAGWTAGAAWPAHNALHGWSTHHEGGDLRSPVGVFTLTDAGGRLADPGSKLRYDHSPIGFAATGTGFEGESLAGAFDYVIAINYNRVPGTSPRDWTRPLGAGRGGGIWFHVDHGGPTHGCVSLSAAHMRELLRTLDPARHPVAVMGDAADLRG